MAYHNATCIIIEPERFIDATDPYKRLHEDRVHDEVRCSMRALSATASIGPLGCLSLNAWRCRVKSSLPVRAEWMVHVKMDDEAEYKVFVVQAVSKGHHLVLTLEGTD